MTFPHSFLDSPTKQHALDQLETFIGEITGTGLKKHIVFKPTCVYIALNEQEQVTKIQLQTYNYQQKQLTVLA